MIIGVPIFAVFYAFVRKHTNSFLQKKGLPVKTDKYTQVEIITSENTFRELKDIPGNGKEKTLKLSKKVNTAKTGSAISANPETDGQKPDKIKEKTNTEK